MVKSPMLMILHSEHCQTSLTCLVTGVYNISFFAVSLFTKLGLGGAETVAVFTALVRCLGTAASTLLLLRYSTVQYTTVQYSTLLLLRFRRRTIYLSTSCAAT